MLTLSELNLSPQNLSIPEPLMEDKYWILNAYGNIDMNALLIKNLAVMPLVIDDPNQVELFSRQENRSLDDWDSEGNPESITQNPLNLTFNSTRILSRQFILGANNVSATDDSTLSEINLYPNPTSDFIIADNIPAQTVMSIYNGKGMLLLKKEISSNQRTSILDNLLAGIYSYILENDGVLKTGQLVVSKK